MLVFIPFDAKRLPQPHEQPPNTVHLCCSLGLIVGFDMCHNERLPIAWTPTVDWIGAPSVFNTFDRTMFRKIWFILIVNEVKMQIIYLKSSETS